MKSLVLDPYIPLSLWMPLALGGAGLLIWYGIASRRRLPLGRWVAVMGLMSAALAVPLAILLNPTWLERLPPPGGKPVVTILVDRSASMATQDASDDEARFEVASRLAAETSKSLADRYEVRLRCFSEDSMPTTVAELENVLPDGGVTNLAAAIEEALEGDCPQGQTILLLSDGGHNAGRTLAEVRQSVAKAKAMTAPVMVHTLGGQTRVQDLEVRLNLPEELAFVGQRVPVLVDLEQRGSLARRVRLSIEEEGRVVESRDAELLPDGRTEEVFYVTEDTPGLYRYQIKADPLPAEATTVNNAATLLVRVVDEPVRVLLLEGKPYWDTKFLIRTLAGDELIELVSLVRLAEGRFLERKLGLVAEQMSEAEANTDEADSTPPTIVATDQWRIRKDVSDLLAGEEADDIQIVVLGRDAEVFLTDPVLDRLDRWLKESDGSLVCFRGAPSSQIGQRLGSLMPVRWKPAQESRFHMEWTESGRALRWLPSAGEDDRLLPGLPSLAKVTQMEQAKPLAVVLATEAAGQQGAASPVLTYQRVGSGRVVVVEGAGMWRWAFLPPMYRQHDEVYGLLWRSLTRWLVANVGLLPSQNVALRTPKVTFSVSDNVSLELLVRGDLAGGDVPRVELTGDALDAPRQVAAMPSGSYPGQYRVPFGRLPEGRYRARVSDAGDDEVSATCAFDVRGNLKERLQVEARADLMQLVAEGSGGTVLDEVRADDVARRFESHLTRSRPERIQRTMGWDRWWVLAAALAVCATAWGLRRWSGLV